MDKIMEALEVEKTAQRLLGEACSGLAEASRVYVESERIYKLAKMERKALQIAHAEAEMNQPITNKLAKVIPRLLSGWLNQRLVRSQQK